MKRLIFTFLLIAILLGGCNYPGGESTPLSVLATPSDDVAGEVSEERLPTLTNGLIVSSTPTTQPQSSPTLIEQPDTPPPAQQIYPTPKPLVPGEPVTITKIRMFDATTGWGTGYQTDSGAHILVTEDGGHTWEDRTPPELIADIPEENDSAWTHFLDPWTAWVIYAPQGFPPPVQAPMIWRTIDGGLTWEPSPPLQVDGMEDFFTPEGFAAIEDQFGWLLVHVGAGMSHDYSYLYASMDGGVHWERIVDPYGIGLQSLQNTGIAFADPMFGWVSKDNLGVMPGAFFEQTTDGGTSWENVFLPVPPELDWFNESSLCRTSAPTFPEDQTGLLVVKCRVYGDIQANVDWSLTYIYTTRDRGGSWEHIRLSSPVESLIFLNPDDGWALGHDLNQTSDGGMTWDLTKSVNWDGDFSFADPLNGWAVARNQDEIALVVTADGGTSWQIIEPVVSQP